MSDEIVKVVVLSHKRAGLVTTIPRVLPADKVALCVPQAQYDGYAEHHPDTEIVAHPDDIVGLSRKRQWIYERWGDVMMVDDDFVVCTHFEHAKSSCVVDPETGYEIIQRLAGNAKDLGVFLFGFSTYADIRTFNPMTPFKTAGFVVGGTLGMLAGSRLFYNPELVAADDYWISALNAYYHRSALIDLRYIFTSKGRTFKTTGGTADIRTMDTERNDNKVLRHYFGSDIIREKPRPFFAPGAAGHAEQRTLILPF